MTYRYTILLWPEDDGCFSVTVPLLPGCFTWGDTEEQATERAHEAIELFLASLLESGDDIPEEIAQPL